MRYAITGGQPMLDLSLRPTARFLFLVELGPVVATRGTDWPGRSGQREVLVLVTSQHRCLAVRPFCVYVGGDTEFTF